MKLIKVYQYIQEHSLFTIIKLLVKRFLVNLFAVPIAIILFAISPWIKIRFIKLFSFRIGHYALNTELLLTALEKNIYSSPLKYKNFFYTTPHEPICNDQLHRMWKRIIPIFPVSILWNQVDNYLGRFIGKTYQNDPYKLNFEGAEGAQDKWNFLETFPPHLSFTKNEEEKALQQLEKLGIPRNARFICLLGRDSQYLKQHLPTLDWSYHDYRDVDINNYKEAAKFLAEQGYYIIRMGKSVREQFKVSHPNVIDYANSQYCNDLLDIYLSAKCFFFMSPRSGIDAVAQIFRRPLMLTNFPLCDYISLYSLDLFIPKKVLDLNNQQYLNFKTMCWNINRRVMMDMMRSNQWQFVENTSEEIVEAVKEMLGRLTKTWNDDQDINKLQERFWLDIPLVQNTFLSKTVRMRMGESFLIKNQSLLS